MTKRKYWTIGLILLAVYFAGVFMSTLYGQWWILVSLVTFVGMFIHSFKYFRQIANEQAKSDETRPKFLGIMNEVEAERKIQDSTWGKEFDDRNRDLDWMAYIIKYATGGDRLPNTPEEFRKQMIQTAALAVAAIEAIDRGTCKIKGSEPSEPIDDAYGMIALIGAKAGKGIQWPFNEQKFLNAIDEVESYAHRILRSNLYDDFSPKHLDVPPAKGD